jgi:hypothetical protein
MCRLFYLPRRWSVTINYVLVAEPSFSRATTISFNASPRAYTDYDDPGTAFVPSRESDLVLPRYGLGFSWEDVNGAPEWSTDPAQASLTEVTDYVSDNETVADEEYLYDLFVSYPNPRWADGALSFEISLFASIAGVSRAVTAGGGGVIDEPETDGVEIGALTLPEGIVIPIFGTDDAFRVDEFNIDITPIEYWPYATKGDPDADPPVPSVPVYDTATGAQLADPLS